MRRDWRRGPASATASSKSTWTTTPSSTAEHRFRLRGLNTDQLAAGADGVADAGAAGRPVTLVESVTLTVLLSVVLSLMSEKVQSLASAMLPALVAWMSRWANLKSTRKSVV